MSEAPVPSPARAPRKPRARKASAHRQTLRVKLAKSGIATPKDQKATIRAIGFRRVGHVVVRADTPELRGRIRKIRHLVEILRAED